MTSVQQVEHMVQQARLLSRDIANGDEAREIYQIGQFYKDAYDTLARLGYIPNRLPGERGSPVQSFLQASTRLLSVPTPPTVISTRSPALRNRVGEKLPPAPSGEPVAMRSPVFSGVKWEM